jgi:hypothetical protein
MNQHRFCATCYSHRKSEGGSIKQGRVPRWVCEECTNKASARWSGRIAEFAPKEIKKEEWRYR